jgi:hypothetical protein
MSAFQTFTIIVNEVNSAPILTNLNNTTRTIAELTSITLTNVATDTDSPPNVLTYEIVSAPDGATVNPTNGVFNWTPSEAQGPTSNSILVRVFDNGAPSLSATQRFTILVNEVNSAPVLSPIADKTANPGRLLTFTNVVNDPDLPPQTLTFSLVPGPGSASVPTGASIDSATGVFSWTPDISQSPSTNSLSVIVADNGTPSLSATQSFTIFVVPPPIQITDIHFSDATHLVIMWDSVSGKNYRVDACNDLSAAPNCWQTLQTVTASGPTTQSAPIDISADPQPHRFYRIVQGP